MVGEGSLLLVKGIIVPCKASQQATSKNSFGQWSCHCVAQHFGDEATTGCSWKPCSKGSSFVLQSKCPTYSNGHGLREKHIVGTILSYKRDPMSTLNGRLVSLILTKAHT